MQETTKMLINQTWMHTHYLIYCISSDNRKQIVRANYTWSQTSQLLFSYPIFSMLEMSAYLKRHIITNDYSGIFINFVVSHKPKKVIYISDLLGSHEYKPIHFLISIFQMLIFSKHNSLSISSIFTSSAKKNTPYFWKSDLMNITHCKIFFAFYPHLNTSSKWTFNLLWNRNAFYTINTGNSPSWISV